MASISVFGLGHVGLATATCFARRGYEVVGIDKDSNRIKAVQGGKAPFFEPGLERYLQETIASKTLTATSDFQASSGSDYAYITVGTPKSPNGSINLDYIQSVATCIAKCIQDNHKYQIVVVKSTVVPGTTRNHIKPLIEKVSGKVYGKEFAVCTNPEFLREGHAIEDTETPDRIIIGSDDDRAAAKLAALYREFTPGVPSERVIVTSPENAELIKYANNAFLATKVGFINTIANIAENIPGADVAVVARAIGLDSRIGADYLNPGLGWGGSCLPKDMDALAAFCKKIGYVPDLINADIEVNRKQRTKPVEFATRTLGSLKGKRVAILGLSFKPGTDDMREATSIVVIDSLLAEGAEISAYDPASAHAAKELFGEKINLALSARSCLEQADLALIVTEWDEFKKLEPHEFRDLMRTAVVFDGRRIYEPDEMRNAGIVFGAVGLCDRRY